MRAEHREHADVGDRDHVGEPASVAEERELAEHVTGPELSDLAAAVLDAHLALVEHEES
jgi:hypothetical protein